MAFAKWIGGFLGLLSNGPIGFLAGFALGAMFDNLTTDGENPAQADDYSAFRSGSQQAGAPDDTTTDHGTRNGFLFSLLALASYIIKADGRIMHSEMEAMRGFLRNNFGEIAVVQGEQIMLRLFEQQKQMDATQPGAYRQTIHACCQQLRQVLTESQRLQLLSLLAMLARADGNLAPEELAALRDITQQLGLSENELLSMLNLGDTTLQAAYAVLEIDESASDDDVRAAYKRLVIKHHPDRVATLGEEVRAAAEQKLKEINAAKELIFKARGL